MFPQLIVALVSVVLVGDAMAQGRKEAAVTSKATGTFEVKLKPQGSPDSKGVGRMSIDKQFSGDLEASSLGEMLAFMSDVKGSAGYVAMEKVTGKLAGRSGSFVLQHSSTMTRGVPEQNVFVVPDSGTEELQGLTGKMIIVIEGGKHSYVFEYQIATGN